MRVGIEGGKREMSIETRKKEEKRKKKKKRTMLSFVYQTKFQNANKTRKGNNFLSHPAGKKKLSIKKSCKLTAKKKKIITIATPNTPEPQTPHAPPTDFLQFATQSYMYIIYK